MAAENDVIKILMLGEALNRPGGVVTVEKATLALGSPSLGFHHIPTLPRDGAGAAWRKPGMALSALARTFWQLLATRVDIVHIHVSQGASVYRKMLIAWIAFLFAKPVLLHTHGGDVAKRFPHLPTPLRRLIAWTHRRADGVIALGEDWRRFYIEAMGVDADRVIILRNPVRMPETVPVRADNPPLRLLYLGMVSEPKGAFDLIKAASHLPREKHASLQIIMAGHGEVDRARGEVSALGLEDVIDVKGWIEPAERDLLLREMHALVMPSHFEGMPMSLLEAMSFGLTVIATPVGAIPDVVIDGDNGFLIPVGDTDALGKAMSALADDPVRCQTLAAAARKSVEPYSIEGYSAHLTQLYRNLTADHSFAKAS